MRSRVEDLGRLAVLIDNLLDHDLFNKEDRPRRPKDYNEWFASRTADQQDDILRHWVYGIESVSEKLYEMLEIANGTDPLNDSTLE